ncbi:hypothetical protein SD074_21380 [Prolixibacter sp. SD074]|nr:hypothetical protein SD074_21380 [Prolixibacter sp. SD074]
MLGRRGAIFIFEITKGGFEGILPQQFLRVHRNYIVNEKKVSEVNVKQRWVKLFDGTKLPVSFRNIRETVVRLS